MAQRMPAGVTPNHLTTLGVLGAVITAAGFVLSRWSLSWLWLACFGLIVNWFGDSLDGNVARYRRIERPRYGFFVDHVSDLFSQALVFLSLGISPCAHFAVACLGLIMFLMGFLYTLIGAHVHNTMRITYFGFGPTEVRALLFFGNLATLAFGLLQMPPAITAWLGWGPITGYDLGISLLSVVGVVMILSLAIREARALALEDPSPLAKPVARPGTESRTPG